MLNSTLLLKAHGRDLAFKSKCCRNGIPAKRALVQDLEQWFSDFLMLPLVVTPSCGHPTCQQEWRCNRILLHTFIGRAWLQRWSEPKPRTGAAYIGLGEAFSLIWLVNLSLIWLVNFGQFSKPHLGKWTFTAYVCVVASSSQLPLCNCHSVTVTL